MQAIEFKTTIHNGIVTLPSEYSDDWEGKSIRVIVLEDNNTENAPRESQNTTSLFSRLRQIKISAPTDFSENIDTYLNEERNV
jgi:hypothetical protein